MKPFLIALVTAATSLALAAPPVMPIPPTTFGTTKDGKTVEQFVVTNRRGLTAKFISYGATLTSLQLNDRSGKPVDVVLGFDDLASYETKSPYFGCVLGRVANRIANGKFTLDGQEFKLATNEGRHHLNGGVRGFDKVIWKGEAIPFGVRFQYRSPDGEEGYPGNLDVTVTYTVDDNNALKIEYHAVADQVTPVNLTHQSFFNLAGHNSGDVLSHELMIDAPQFTPTDDMLIPTGEMATVANTPFDFRELTVISAALAKIGGPPKGFDLNYMLYPSREPTPLKARLRDPNSGREMQVFTSEPGMQLDIGHRFDGTLKGKGGAVYRRYQGICLDCQRFPDSVNHPEFPSCILVPKQVYTQTTIYHFAQR